MDITLTLIITAVVVFAVLLAIVLSANGALVSAFKKYNRMYASLGLTTQQFIFAAKEYYNIKKLKIARIKGELTDCYIPHKRTIAISESCFGSSSVAALAVVAHEFGHALQHAQRSLLFAFSRIVGFFSRIFAVFALPAILAGLVVFALGDIQNVGVILMCAGGGIIVLGLLFKIITIPVEYNATHRALKFLKESGAMDEDELKIAKKILHSAGFTYVAGFISSILGLNWLRRRLS